MKNLRDEDEMIQFHRVKAPTDRYYIGYISFLILGICITQPWVFSLNYSTLSYSYWPFNSLIEALDFFQEKLPDHDVSYVAPAITFGPFFATHMLMVAFNNWYNPVQVIKICLLAIIVLNIALPIFLEVIATESINWIITLCWVSISSGLNGMVQAWLFGLVGPFPSGWLVSLYFGWSVGGIIVSLARAISLVVFDNDGSDDYSSFDSALLYFLINSLILTIGFIFLTIVATTQFFRYYRGRLLITSFALQVGSWSDMSSPVSTHHVPDVALINESMVSDDFQEDVRMPNVHASIFKTFKNTFWQLLGILIIFIQTYLVLPFILLKGTISFIDNETWKVWFVITLYSASDMISKIIAQKWMLLTTFTTVLVTMIRSLFIGIAILSALDFDLFSDDLIKIFNIIAIGFTNGYTSSCQIIIAWSNAMPYEKELTSKMMSFMIILGIILGNVISSFGVSKLFD